MMTEVKLSTGLFKTHGDPDGAKKGSFTYYEVKTMLE